MAQVNAESLFKSFKKLPAQERARFFFLLAEPGIDADSYSYEQVFGHLADARFTAAEAAEYLEVSLPTFRRYVRQQSIRAVGQVGRSQLFSTRELKAFKRSLQQIRNR
ncbi:UNVERIFIED_ORG: excisionase family DNA binding protein [Zoogloea ramigera]|uniref:Helix-turn-helix domain-containing protein n=1 Tax=Duganella zoogloeoides TaxID=75659 RepID=A0ABZ0XW53_9BURK|nr:helix-turn-helix domain-containing protein [Duganella zoogloeoides]WQH03678.1 helix-turn-helix domain-containing protein [Duganella zoogloeoides]